MVSEIAEASAPAPSETTVRAAQVPDRATDRGTRG